MLAHPRSDPTRPRRAGRRRPGARRRPRRPRPRRRSGARIDPSRAGSGGPCRRPCGPRRYPADGPPSRRASRAASWTPETLRPLVCVWLDASSGYRSGSWPIEMSTTAAPKSPSRSRSAIGVAGSDSTTRVVSPIASQARGHALGDRVERRVHLGVGAEDLERVRLGRTLRAPALVDLRPAGLRQGRRGGGRVGRDRCRCRRVERPRRRRDRRIGDGALATRTPRRRSPAGRSPGGAQAGPPGRAARDATGAG